MPGRQVYNEGPFPQCPHCGCRDCQVMALPEPDSATSLGVALCGNDNCRRIFRWRSAPGDEADVDGECGEEETRPPKYRIVRERLRCPVCESPDYHTYTTRQESDGVLRYHVCRKCSNRFSSLER